MKVLLVKFPRLEDEFFEKLCKLAEKLEYDIEIFPLDEREGENIKNYPVRSLAEMQNFSWDAVILVFISDMAKDFFLDVNKSPFTKPFRNSRWLLKQFMIKKYEDVNDPAIQETLEYWKTHELTVFNQHLVGKEGSLNRVFFDDPSGLPNIYFQTVGGEWRKMFYPRDGEFFIHEGEKFVKNLMAEQLPTSPHLYTKGEHTVNAGDILIDAGVCEGNFALRYVDLCSKMYLFESDSSWLESLKETFRDYRDKVEIIPKFLSDVTDGEQITLDDALPNLRGKNIFLKMDIEGYEPKALRGAKNLLTNNFVKASACAYHNADDCIKIKSIFQKYGYKTSTSDGWMVFLHDPNILDTADFRKGVVYAENY